MFRNIFYDTKKSQIHLWETVKGKTFYGSYSWVPYVFQPTDKETGIKSLQGDNVEKKEFADYREYREYQESTVDIFENKVPPATQFLAERYYEIPDEEMEVPDLKIYSLDIEVHRESGGFPHANDAEHPIVLINIKEFGGPSITWGLKEYTGDNPDNINFKKFASEAELIRNFLNWWHRNTPDVVTGWNIIVDNKMNSRGGFDFPYIINRCKVLFGSETPEWRKLSPIGIVRIREDQKTNTMMVDIAGVTILDYMAIYKWYTPKNLPNYKLETVCQEELGIGKTDLSEYDNDLRKLFHENWNLYVEYNAIDDIRIEELEEKLGYIKLAQSLSLLCKMPMRSYSAATQAAEGLLLTYYRRNKLCAPYFTGGQQEWFPAAFVKEPCPGLYNWVIDLDIASSYPTAIITLNMSIETYYGRILTFNKAKSTGLDDRLAYSESEIISSVEKRHFERPFDFISPTKGIMTFNGKKLEIFNKSIERGLIAVAPCGSCFKTTSQGAIADVERTVFLKRKEVKKKMFEIKKKANDDPKLKDRAKELFALQWALKIVLNGMFGVTGVPYSRYFNPHISEAITSCAKNTILMGQKLANELLNNPEQDDKLVEILKSLK